MAMARLEQFQDELYLWADAWLQEHTDFIGRERAALLTGVLSSVHTYWGVAMLARNKEAQDHLTQEGEDDGT